MAGISARNAAIFVSGYKLTEYFDDYDSSESPGLEESTTFHRTRKSKTYLPTLTEAVVRLSGLWSGDTGAVDRVLQAALNTTNKILSIFWEGDAVGNAGVCVDSYAASKKVQAKVAGLNRVDAEFKSNVGEEDVVSLHTIETVETGASFGSTIVDNGAASTDGSAFLQVENYGTALTVTIRHSSDNFGADDTLLGSFDAVAADNSAQRIALSGTIKRYTRVAWTLTGNASFSVALHRKP